MFNREELEAASRLVHEVVPPTPQFRWPLLTKALGAEVWVKHENHTPLGAFKVRGGITFMAWLKAKHPEVKGVIAATRGNHGQSVALAAARAGLSCTILVPHGNSSEKNAAMQALGAELIVHGEDFQASLEEAQRLAKTRGLYPIPSFHKELVRGVATYGFEFFSAAPGLTRVYVPIGLGSGICGVIAARDALGLTTEIVGVVSSAAPAYALSFERGQLAEHETTTKLADGMACRTPNAESLEIIWKKVARIVQVSDQDIAAAMRLYFSATHNVAEGAGAAALAAAIKEPRNASDKIGLVLSGGNVDRVVFAKALAEENA